MHDSNSEDGCLFISLGVCAMAKKTKSKPMKEILRRLEKFQHIRIIVFEERVILKQPIEAWPLCDALISFYSDGFPLEKAIAYSQLRKPYLVNDLEAQYVLMDRKKVYEALQSEGVPVPRYACVERNDTTPANVVEHDDTIEIDGEVFHKPFVEKPLNAEDHNIYIYFPSSAGGGSQRLFRKVGDRSSKYFQISTIRTEGSYLYEEFMPTDGTDVKVYTVADDYAHAEARKSPALDGKVERDHEGKEIRYPVILTPREKIIAKKVAKVVRQQICGFDLLRANGMSYVCDVNGFSFVKTSRKYYDDASHVLGVLITRVIAPRLCPTGLGPWIAPGTDDDIPLVPTTCGTIMELRCVIAVFRHGDRTPKQKMKMEVRHEKFFQLFHKYAGGRSQELKLKKPTQLQEVLDIVRGILEDIESGKLKNSVLEEKKAKFEQLRYVLEMHGSFSGINRKIQLKFQPNGRKVGGKKKKPCGKNAVDDLTGRSRPLRRTPSSRSVASNTAGTTATTTTLTREEGDELDCTNFRCAKPGDGSIVSGGGGTANDGDDDDPCILLVVKWGGELTAAGKQQAEELGRAFRCIYPGGDGNYGKNPGLGLLRLHSTYRHDLKIYASDEGRVQMTAAAFAKGFLALEGELPPILVQMVKSANTNGLLDNDNDCHHYQQIVKKRIKKIMSYKGDWAEEHRLGLAPTGARSLLNAMSFVRDPLEACGKLFGYVQRLANRVAMLTASPRERSRINLYHNESWDLLLRRWGKLVKDFRSPSGEYDVSKLPDIYDNIKYDIQHNSGILIESEMLDFFSLARALADIVVPQEYGITREEKLVIGQRICTPLLRKILSDARYTDVDECTRLHAGYSKGVASPERFVRTRLYFTSESHLHSILTCLQYGGLADALTDEQWKRAMDYVSTVPELNYLSQVVIMIYEDPTVEPKTEKKFHVELHFSPGAHALCRDLPAGSGFRPGRRENGWCSSLMSSSTSLAETSFDSASEKHVGADRTPTHYSSSSGPHQSGNAAAIANVCVPTPAYKNPSACPTLVFEAPIQRNLSDFRSLYIDRSLPNDLQEVGREVGIPPVPPILKREQSEHKESRQQQHRRHPPAVVRMSSVYQPAEIQSGLCYANIVNQDAVEGHRSRMQELWLESTRTISRASERSMSSEPMVEHAPSMDASNEVTFCDTTVWHDKTITTTPEDAVILRTARSSGDNDPLHSSARPISAQYTQTHGRFTVTSQSTTSSDSSQPFTISCSNPDSKHCWFTHSMELEDDDIETTGEPEQLSASRSTLDMQNRFTSCGTSPSGPSASIPRPFSATTPGSPLKWTAQSPPSPTTSSSNVVLSRRMSFGATPMDFFTLQPKTACLDDGPSTTGVHTSLDSVKPDRAQELLDQGAPVAQWLMEYFDQIEKAKWSKTGDAEDDESNSRSRSKKNYRPILSAADYLNSDARAIPNNTPGGRKSTNRRSSKDVSDSAHMHVDRETADTTTTLSPVEGFGGRVVGRSQPSTRGSSLTNGEQLQEEQGSSALGSQERSRHPSIADTEAISAMELNALTYPNSQVALKGLQKCPLGNDSCSLVDACPTKRVRGLISTAVIRGSKDIYSSSVPDLVQLLNAVDSEEQQQASPPQISDEHLLVPSAPCVPEIYPLETLHNAMTLHQLEGFFARLTTTKFPSPFTSPSLSSIVAAGGSSNSGGATTAAESRVVLVESASALSRTPTGTTTTTNSLNDETPFETPGSEGGTKGGGARPQSTPSFTAVALPTHKMVTVTSSGGLWRSTRRPRTVSEPPGVTVIPMESEETSRRSTLGLWDDLIVRRSSAGN